MAAGAAEPSHRDSPNNPSAVRAELQGPPRHRAESGKREVLVSAAKRWIPREVRIAAYIMIIATFVQIADFTLAAQWLHLRSCHDSSTPLQRSHGGWDGHEAGSFCSSSSVN